MTLNEKFLSESNRRIRLEGQRAKSVESSDGQET
jgi:hypothetical protein